MQMGELHHLPSAITNTEQLESLLAVLVKFSEPTTLASSVGSFDVIPRNLLLAKRTRPRVTAEQKI